MIGILEKNILDFKNKVIDNYGIVKLEFITDYIQNLQNHKYDAHVVIQGQNGNGKSLLMLALMSLIDKNSIRNGNIIYAYDKTSKLLDILSKKKKTVVGIDELKKFFHYKRSMTTEQILLTNMIEYARENNNAFIGCANDIRRLNNNYRNAKVQMVIWLLDRYENREVKNYGIVFIGNPALEEEDKFQMERFKYVQSFKQIKNIAERLPTMFGYVVMDDISKYIDKEDLKLYEANKKKGIIDQYKKYIEKLKEVEEKDKKKKRKEAVKLMLSTSKRSSRAKLL